MIKFFHNRALVDFSSNYTTPYSDEEIFLDAVSMEERLLQELETRLKEPSYCDEDVNRLKRLHTLGFSKAKQVQPILSDVYNRDDALRTFDLIKDYQQRYPFNKFIDEKSINIICQKYGLVLGDAYAYIGGIPRKNQEEIVNFRVKCIDTYYRKQVRSSSPPEIIYYTKIDALGRMLGISKEEFEMNNDEEMISATMLKVIAPISKFDKDYVKFSKLTSGYKIEPKDPIVLQPVRGGYLIVSSWLGDGEDPKMYLEPSIQNPNKN